MKGKKGSTFYHPVALALLFLLIVGQVVFDFIEYSSISTPVVASLVLGALILIEFVFDTIIIVLFAALVVLTGRPGGRRVK